MLKMNSSLITHSGKDSLIPFNKGILHVTVNFLCQLDWAKGWPDSWQNIISQCICEGVTERY